MWSSSTWTTRRPRGCSSRPWRPSPGITIAERANDLGAAASAIRAGRAIAAVYLPPGFRQGRAGRPRAARRRLHNTQYFTPGNNAAKSIRDADDRCQRGGRARRRPLGARGGAGPGLVPEEYVLSNPALNYAQFLLRAVLPTVLHVVIAISAALCGRLGVPAPKPARWWDIVGPQHRSGAGRQAAAVFRRADADVRADGRHPRPVARRQLPRRRG